MITVLSVGPLPQQPGGIATVAFEMESSNAASDDDVNLRFVDSGGTAGPWALRLWKYLRCLALVAFRPADVVHLHVASRGSTWRKLLAARICRLRNKRYVLHLHGGAYPHFVAQLSGPQRRAVTCFFQRAAYVIVLGNTWRCFVTSELEVPPARVRVVRNGISAPPRLDTRLKTSPTDATPYALYLGRIERTKGVADILSAAQQLTGLNLSIVLAGPAGDDSLREELLSASTDSTSSIIYRGPVDRAQARELLSGARVLLLPSYAEAFGLTLIEAMSAGIPSIGSAVGGVLEVLSHGVEGFLISPGDVDALAEYIRVIVTDEALHEALSEAAHSTWESRFQAERMYRELRKIWGAVASGRLAPDM